MKTQDWKSSLLPSLLELLKSGGTPSTTRNNFYGGEIPFVSIEDMTACSKYLSKTIKSLTREGLKNSNAWLVPDGCVLYSIYATLGITRINVIPVATNQAILAMIPHQDRIDQSFLYYWLESARETIVNVNSAQTTQKNLSATIVKTFIVYHPTNKSEQSKIAEVLSKVDQAIEQTESLIAKQQRIKTGLMQDLLTRGIDEHGSLRSEETHEFKDSSLGRIPVEWEVDKLENVSDFITSGSRGWARYYSEEGAIFIRIGNLIREHVHMRFDDVVYVNPPLTSEGKRTAVNAGDLLISITADLGIIAVIPDEFPEAYVNQHIALVRLNKSKIVPCFAGWFLAGYRGQSQFDKLNESGAKAGLNLPTVKNLLVPRLDFSEQEQIVNTLEANIYSLKGHQSQLFKLRFLKTALMQDLLTGKKRVTPLMEKMEASI